MLGNSPDSSLSLPVFDNSPGSDALLTNEGYMESKLGYMDLSEDELFPEIPMTAQITAASNASTDRKSSDGGINITGQKPKELTLAEELGVSESPPDTPVAKRPESPLPGQKKKIVANGQSKTTKGRVLHAGSQAKEKAPVRTEKSAVTFPSGLTATKKANEKEKENSAEKKPTITKVFSRPPSQASDKTATKTGNAATTRKAAPGKMSQTGGPRRVLVETSKAPWS
jgi:hypothetical protein